MKLIVIQRHSENLVGIKAEVAKINKLRAEEIIFTDIPEQVLESVRDDSPAIVVSGQILDIGILGTDLARKVKRVNPKTQFYMYSVMPDRNESVDGIIPKSNGTAASGQHPLLAQILASNLDDATPEMLKQKFQVR